MISCEILLQYEDGKTASSIYRAVEPENSGYVESMVEGNRIVFRISGKDALSLSHTVNDLLACVKAAESAVIGRS